MGTAIPMIPFTDRIREHTASPVNEKIDAMTRAKIDKSVQGGRDAIIQRLVVLDREWDIDRAVMMNFAVLGGASFGIGLKRFAAPRLFGPRPVGFLVFFGVQMAFLALHATAGWCPPVAVFRRLGFRSKAEIESERRELLDALGREPG